MIAAFFNWLGAAMMMAAPFIIDTNEGKILSICALFLLSLQAWRMGALNLVALNIVGIIGYCYALYI